MNAHLDYCPRCEGDEGQLQTRLDGRRWCTSCGWLSDVTQATLSTFHA